MTVFLRPPMVFGTTAVQKNQQVGYGDFSSDLVGLSTVAPPKVTVDLDSFFVRQNHFLMAPSNKLLPLYSAGAGAARARRQAVSRSARKQRILTFLQKGPKPQNMIEAYHKLVTTILSSENNYFGWYNFFLPERIPGPSFYYEIGTLKDGSGGVVFGPEEEGIVLYPNGEFRAFVKELHGKPLLQQVKPSPYEEKLWAYLKRKGIGEIAPEIPANQPYPKPNFPKSYIWRKQEIFNLLNDPQVPRPATPFEALRLLHMVIAQYEDTHWKGRYVERNQARIYPMGGQALKGTVAGHPNLMVSMMPTNLTFVQDNGAIQIYDTPPNDLMHPYQRVYRLYPDSLRHNPKALAAWKKEHLMVDIPGANGEPVHWFDA